MDSALDELIARSITLRLPSRLERQMAVLLAGLTLIVSIVLYVSREQLSPAISGFSGTFLSFVVLSTVGLYHWAPMYVLRMVLLAIPGLVTGALILLNQPGVRISYHAQRFQTYDMAAAIILLTSIALSSSAIGWAVAAKRPKSQSRKVPPRSASFNLRFAVYSVIAVAAGTITASSLGPFVWIAPYASSAKEPLLRIGVFPILGVIGVLGMFSTASLDARMTRLHWYGFGLVSVYVLIVCMFLRGMRLEVLAALVAMYLARYEVNVRKIKPLRLAVVAFGLFVLVEAWGIYRASADLDLGLGRAIYLAVANLSNGSGTEIKVYNLGTIGDIASTLYNTVGLTYEGILGQLSGRSYLEYIPRTLPEFLYPERPQDLAYIFVNFNETSGGGFFELAEAFINFGMVGSVIIPGLLTYCFARVYRRMLMHRSSSSFMAYTFVLSLLFRGTWYQTFSIYKAFLTWLVLEILIFVLGRIVEGPHGKKLGELSP